MVLQASEGEGINRLQCVQNIFAWVVAWARWTVRILLTWEESYRTIYLVIRMSAGELDCQLVLSGVFIKYGKQKTSLSQRRCFCSGP